MNVRVNLNYPIYDGTEIVFKAPCDASDVTGLIVYYPSDAGEVSSVFTFADAHANDLGNIDALFAAGAVVKVIIDTDTNMAFVQNAVTNAYLEERFAGMGGGGGGSTLIVTINEEDYASHTSAQIYAHAKSGGTVYLQKGSQFATLATYTENMAVFALWSVEDGSLFYHIYSNRFVEPLAHDPVQKRVFFETIGDISTALDELHAYAESLKGGEAV